MKQIGKLGAKRSNFGPRSSRLDQKDPQDRRGYLRKLWAWKTLKKPDANQNILRDVPQFSRGFSLNPAEPTYKRLGAI